MKRVALLMLVAACGGPPPSTTTSTSTSTSTPTPTPTPTPTSTSTSTSTSTPSSTSTATDDEAIAKAGKAWLDLVVEISPETATTLGLHARDTELDDRTPAGVARIIEREEAMLAGLRQRFAKPNASPSSLTDLAILEHALAVDVKVRREERPNETQPDSYTDPMTAIFLMTVRDYAPAADRAHAALERLAKIPAMLEEARKTLKNPPKVWTQVGIEASAGAKAFFEEQRAPLEQALPAEKAKIGAALKAATDAYAAYAKWLEKDLLPRSTGSFAAGRPLFEFLLHEDYFLDQDADQLLAIGKRVFADTQAKLTETAKKIDPNAKKWRDVVEKSKAHHPTADDLLPSYRREVDRARKFLVDKDVVSFPPGDELQVIETPQFQRTTIQAAYDEPPPFDPVTKGLFFVTPVEKSWSAARKEEWLRVNDHGDQVDTVVHEAYPGHHLQLSFARLHPSLIRKATGPSIFAEGWALYCEELLAELGYYTDEERLLQLEWTLVRAARVIVDIGLHTQGMTFDQAVKLLTDEVGLEKALATNEVKRYSLEPTQPLSYLIGRERIFAIRERYKAREKDAFTLKRFHTDLLSHGTIAPGLLEREMFAGK